MSQNVWNILGIGADSDERAVKRAYAACLKKTNPEDDAEGFKALRSAYEAALGHVRARAYLRAYQEADDEDDEGVEDVEVYEDDQDDEAVAPSASPPPIPPRPAIAPQAAPEQSSSDIHTALRFDLARAVRRKATPFEIQACLEAVLTAPQMEEITIFTATEAFIIDLIEGEVPASEILINRSVAFFGWERSKDQFAYAPGQRVLAVRKQLEQDRDSIEFLALLQRKKHYLHPALYEANTDPDTRSWLSRMLGLRHLTQVRHVFEYLDEKSPDAFDRLNPKAVAWLRHRIEHVLPWFENWKSALIIIGVIIVALFLTMR